MLYPNLNHRLAHLSFAFHSWAHHKPSKRQQWTQSRISHYSTINAKLSTPFDVHGGFSNGYPTSWAAISYKLKLVTQAINWSSLTPGLETTPRLPATDGEPMRPEDEPGARVWSGHTVGSWGGDKGSDHGGRCNGGARKVVNHDHPPFSLPPGPFSLVGKGPHPSSIIAVEVRREGPDHTEHQEANISIGTKERSTKIQTAISKPKHKIITCTWEDPRWLRFGRWEDLELSLWPNWGMHYSATKKETSIISLGSEV